MENAKSIKKDSPEHEDAAQAKRRQPEDLGALAVISEHLPRLFMPEKPAHGHVGAAAIRAEAKPARTAREKSSSPETKPAGGKNIETMSRAELLVLSDHIMIDGTSLRQIYETHLIGEQGLRRLAAEHFRDGDLKKALRQEIIERQIDFERDPAVRDMAVYVDPVATAGSTGASKAALDELLKQTDLADDNRSEEAAFFKARAMYEADQLLQHKQQRRLLDISIAAVVAVLIFLILALYMNRP